jgi:RNA polymerase sigma-70 factor, ECF subfamily
MVVRRRGSEQCVGIFADASGTMHRGKRMTMTCLDSTVDLILGEEQHLRVVARRLAQCDSDADDLVQDTLLRAYRARARFRPGTSVRAWTSTILRRCFLTGVLRAKRRGLQTDTDAGCPLHAAVDRPRSPLANPTFDDQALDDWLDDTVKRALDRVPDAHRKPFVLSAVRDMSCQAIGQYLRVPVGTVMSRVHRARERLRRDLSQHRRARLERA